mmetsp:Transcript_9785/g.16146  ORF Transcript_9785/g.16146 Transcript_9785/m.16146 type:complete len:178 (+) Transcript_9785:74-607(+)
MSEKKQVKASKGSKGGANAPKDGRPMSDTYDMLRLREFMSKQDRIVDTWKRDGMFVRMPRNPVNGDATNRDEAPFAIPFHHSLMLKLEELKHPYQEPPTFPKMHHQVDKRETTFARPSPTVNYVQHQIQTVKSPNLRNLKRVQSSMINEIEQMKRVAEMKRSSLDNALEKRGTARFG